MKLYQVTTIDNKFSCSRGFYKNVQITWYRDGSERKEVNYSEVIEDYETRKTEKDIELPKYAIDEYFTIEEAEALYDYLEKRNEKTEKTSIVPVKLPIPFNAAPVMPFYGCEKHTGIISLYDEKDYDLNFKVEGIYDLYEAEYMGPTLRYHNKMVAVDPTKPADSLRYIKHELRGLSDSLDRIKKAIDVWQRHAEEQENLPF